DGAARLMMRLMQQRWRWSHSTLRRGGNGWLVRFALLLLLPVGLGAPLWLSAQSDEPAAELASFQIADGFEVNLFASETNGVVKPIQIRFDPQGRLWVIG